MPRKFYSQANQQYRTDLLPRETGFIFMIFGRREHSEGDPGF